MSQEKIVIVGMARTPMGGLLGDIYSVPASDLGATAITAAMATDANALFLLTVRRLFSV